MDEEVDEEVNKEVDEEVDEEMDKVVDEDVEEEVNKEVGKNKGTLSAMEWDNIAALPQLLCKGCGKGSRNTLFYLLYLCMLTSSSINMHQKYKSVELGNLQGGVTTMMIALTMFSKVSQQDLTCSFTALHSNHLNKEKALKGRIRKAAFDNKNS